jgi:broad specificity phosphatase PhoE
VSELILVRHGQASFGAESYDKLSPLGEEQVMILARYWQTLEEQFDHLYCGQLLRQKQTAQHLLPLLKSVENAPVIHAGLNEYDGTPIINIYLRDHHPVESPLSLPILDRKEFQKIFEAATSLWIRGELEPNEEDEGFELWTDFQARVHGTIDELMAKHSGGARVIVSTSGGVIALALQRVLGLPDAQVIAANWMVNNSSVTRIRYGGGRVSLSLFNGLSHLEHPSLREKITYR